MLVHYIENLLVLGGVDLLVLVAFSRLEKSKTLLEFRLETIVLLNRLFDGLVLFVDIIPQLRRYTFILQEVLKGDQVVILVSVLIIRVPVFVYQWSFLLQDLENDLRLSSLCY